ncbi:MAG: hypothetical protein C0582_04660 [Alphaproteobacteria bacterium]|nr:MAG: hypothetical protein C0582_04660 [Alphaproteobacteria bacterium]
MKKLFTISMLAFTASAFDDGFYVGVNGLFQNNKVENKVSFRGGGNQPVLDLGALNLSRQNINPNIVLGYLYSIDRWVLSTYAEYTYLNDKKSKTLINRDPALLLNRSLKLTHKIRPSYGITMKCGYKINDKNILSAVLGYVKEDHLIKTDVTYTGPPISISKLSTKIKPNVIKVGMAYDYAFSQNIFGNVEMSYGFKDKNKKIIRQEIPIQAGISTSNVKIKRSWQIKVGVSYKF